MIESFIFHCVVGIVPSLQLEKRTHRSENKLRFKEKWPQQYTLLKAKKEKELYGNVNQSVLLRKSKALLKDMREIQLSCQLWFLPIVESNEWLFPF